MRKKQNLIITICCLIVIIVSSIVFLLNDNCLSPKVIMQDSLMPGYGIMFASVEGQGLTERYVYLNGEDEFFYNIDFINNSGYDNEFALIIFLNYEQVFFSLDNSSEVLTEYRFNLSNRERVAFPVRFPIENMPYKINDVVATVIAGPNKNTIDLGDTHSFYSISRTLKLHVTEYDIQQISNNFYENKLYKAFESETFNGVLLNQDKYNNMILPELMIHAKPGQKVNLNLFAGGYPDVEKFIVWILVGWEQAAINNEYMFLYFNVSKGNVIFKEIFFYAPEQEGMYEISAFIATDPWKDLTADVDNTQIDTSYRFTLKVGVD